MCFVQCGEVCSVTRTAEENSVSRRYTYGQEELKAGV